jgi:hypothetical protein
VDFCSNNGVGCAPGCGCLDDIGGVPFCAQAVGCVACDDDGDFEDHPAFGPGSVCAVATGEFCNCPGGKGCAQACG